MPTTPWGGKKLVGRREKESKKEEKITICVNKTND